jgi:protein TonB
MRREGLLLQALLLSVAGHAALIAGIRGAGSWGAAGSAVEEQAIDVTITLEAEISNSAAFRNSVQEAPSDQAQPPSEAPEQIQSEQSPEDPLESKLPAPEPKTPERVKPNTPARIVSPQKQAAKEEDQEISSAAPALHRGAGTSVRAATQPSAGDGTLGVSVIDARLLGITPQYPRFARQQGQQGRVICRVEVNNEGHAKDVTVENSSGFPLLDAAAVSALQEATFEQSQITDSASARVGFTFKLADR